MMLTCSSRPNFVADSHPSDICSAYAVAHAVVGTKVLRDTLYSAEGTGGRCTDLGSCCRSAVVRCDQFGDDGGIFVRGEGRGRSIYVVDSRLEFSVVRSIPKWEAMRPNNKGTCPESPSWT
jgi:hypothetical protein